MKCFRKLLNSKLLLWDYLIFYLALMRAQPTDYLTSKTTAVFMKTVATVQVVLDIGHLAKTGTAETTTAMVCRDLIRMMIMIFNTCAPINFRHNLRAKKLFSKKIHLHGKPCKYYTFRVLYIPSHLPNSPIFGAKPLPRRRFLHHYYRGTNI